MGRKQDINTGAGTAALVVAAIGGFAAGSFFVGIVIFVVVVGILSVLKVIR